MNTTEVPYPKSENTMIVSVGSPASSSLSLLHVNMTGGTQTPITPMAQTTLGFHFFLQMISFQPPFSWYLQLQERCSTAERPLSSTIKTELGENLNFL